MAQVCTAALEYLERGWSVFPVAITFEDGKWRKRPLIQWEARQTARPTMEQVEAEFALHPNAGIGVALGQISGIIRIDAEGPVPWDKYPLPETAEFGSISGGGGYLYNYMEGAVTTRLWKGTADHQELRVQSNGSYTVVPPTQGYSWVREGPIVNIPDWLYNFYTERTLRDLCKDLRPTLRKPDRGEIVEVLQHLDPDDYDMWIKVGMTLKTAGEEYFEVWDEWSKRSAKYGEGGPKEQTEYKWSTFHGGADGVTTRSLFKWAEEAGWIPSGRHEPLTDRGNANMLIRFAEGKIRHSSMWGWLAWNGKLWNKGADAEKLVQELQKEVIQARLDQCIKSLAKHLKKDRDSSDWKVKERSKRGTIRSIYNLDSEVHYRGARILASSDKDVTVDYREFDKANFLLNCPNGTVDLRSSEMREHSIEDKLTQMCPVIFDPDAQAPLWEKFLCDIVPDAEVREFLARFFGCCLTGDTTAQMMPVFWGTGANGKSTLIQTVFGVLGEDYSMKAKRDLLISARNTSHPTSIARLHGKRFVACVETDELGRLDEPLLKELTGDDSIAARRMREDEWEFIPSHKLVLATNHKPEVRGTDDGIWRRIPLVPFEQKFLPDDPRRDPDLKDKLKAEAPGILQWMARGCLRWLADGKKFLMPETVKAATRDYRNEQDKIGLFICEVCEVGEAFEVHTGKLMDAYAAWCFTNKVTQLNGQKFGRALTERGYSIVRDKYRGGLKLRG